jgi:hypothetical protein
MKEFPLVKIKIAPSTVDIANRKVERAIQELSGEDRNRFLGLSNAWQNQGDNQIQLSKYSGIFQVESFFFLFFFFVDIT